MEKNSSLGERKNVAAQGEPWRGLLTGAAPRDHIVQLYQDEADRWTQSVSANFADHYPMSAACKN
jgi:hypothetical protein